MSQGVLDTLRRTLGEKYTIEREVGRGGAAKVYRAYAKDGTPVALKVLHPELGVSTTAQRFHLEIKMLSTMNHPRIARLLDFGEADLMIYYVMDFIEGPSLREHLKKERRISVPDTMHIARDLLGALAYAQGHGVIHRDVKPENIALARAGAVLMDFGVARAVATPSDQRLTRSGFTVGTSAYMSPEQILGEDIDHRGDLYSLGCVLFECLAGRPPFTHPIEEYVMQMHREMPPPDIAELRKDVPAEVAAAINGAVRKERGERWQSAAAMAAALGWNSLA